MRYQLLFPFLGITWLGGHAALAGRPTAPVRTAITGADGRTHRITEMKSGLAGYVRGVKPGVLLKTEEITPEALFGKKLSPDLISFGQGGAGDCYALSAAKVYANKASKFYAQHKEVLKAVFLNPDGTLRRSKAGIPQARFFKKNRATGVYEAVLIDYTGVVPMRNGAPVFASEAHKNGQAWGPIFEEVFTKFREDEGGHNAEADGYARTGNGGYSFHVMEALTGQPAEHFQLRPHNLKESLTRINEALKRGDVVTTGSNSLPVIKQRLEEAIKLGLVDGRSRRINFEGERPVKFSHEYGLTRLLKDKVETANPWNIAPVFMKGKHGIGRVAHGLYPVLYGDFDIGRGATPKDAEQ
jgi:hypothetical protein